MRVGGGTGRRALGGALVLLPVLVGCSSGGAHGSQGGSTTIGPGASAVSGVLAQNREDEVKGQAVVRLTLAPGSASSARVGSLTLDWPDLAPAPASRPDYPLTPGVPVDLPVAYGAARCATSGTGGPDPASTPSASAPAAVLMLDGSQVRIPLADPASVSLAHRIFARSCGIQAVAAAADLRFGPTWTDATVGGLPGLTGTLVVTRRQATGPVSVTALEGSVLLALAPAPGTALPAVLAPGSGTLLVPVTLTTSGRCDGHALGESKKTYVLTALVDIGDGVARPVTLSPVQGVRSRIWATLLAGCRASGGAGA